MSKAFDQEAIMDFVTSDSRNLALSLSILSIESKIRMHIIDSFLDKLKAEVIEVIESRFLIDEWEISFDNSKNTIRYSSLFQIKKKSWNNEYAIMLEPQQGNINSLCYGIKSKHKTGRTEEGKKIHELVLSALDAGGYALDRSQSTEWWPYCPWVAEEFMHWGQAETLLLLSDSTNTSKALHYFVDKFIALVEITSIELDKFIESK